MIFKDQGVSEPKIFIEVSDPFTISEENPFDVKRGKVG
jgi:hypothetical protein